ncbi:MAG: phosphatidylglycerophosphatase A, partial [Verrucomicrobia bacterium]|nr:phosphatidylglycerophosphatase A [Verrucomicrobiota bacterium]
MSQKRQKHWTATLACLGPFGHLPKAPGTWGTLVAIPFAIALLLLVGVWGTLLVSLVLIPFSVWCCGTAEQVLQKRDPGCVVLDEFVAVPVCYLGAALFFPQIHLLLSTSQSMFSAKGVSLHIAVFILFRIFDIWKPWPVGPSQKWPRGWGVVMD